MKKKKPFNSVSYEKGKQEALEGKPFDHSLEEDTSYVDGWLDGFNDLRATREALEREPEGELVEV